MTLPRSSGVERAVILHVDDIGMCHGANQACIGLARQGYVTCGSVMVPCPRFREIAEAAAADPSLDLGVHLTLTSEWQGCRWAPMSTVSRASGLIDDDGYFWRDVASLGRHLVPRPRKPSCAYRSSGRRRLGSCRRIAPRTWPRQCCESCLRTR